MNATTDIDRILNSLDQVRVEIRELRDRLIIVEAYMHAGWKIAIMISLFVSLGVGCVELLEYKATYEARQKAGLTCFKNLPSDR